MLRFFSLLSPCLIVLSLLSACSPTYDWREVRGSEAPYLTMMPGKPSIYTRLINLNGIEVSMTMTATEVEETVFAVGSAKLTEPGQAGFALEAMKTALIKNIDGTVRNEKILPIQGQPPLLVRELEAVGNSASPDRPPYLLLVRLLAKDEWIYQVLVLGPESKVNREEAATFLASFKVQ